jgi:hypothetical protein
MPTGVYSPGSPEGGDEGPWDGAAGGDSPPLPTLPERDVEPAEEQLERNQGRGRPPPVPPHAITGGGSSPVRGSPPPPSLAAAGMEARDDGAATDSPPSPEQRRAGGDGSSWSARRSDEGDAIGHEIYAKGQDFLAERDERLAELSDAEHARIHTFHPDTALEAELSVPLKHPERLKEMQVPHSRGGMLHAPAYSFGAAPERFQAHGLSDETHRRAARAPEVTPHSRVGLADDDPKAQVFQRLYNPEVVRRHATRGQDTAEQPLMEKVIRSQLGFSDTDPVHCSNHGHNVSKGAVQESPMKVGTPLRGLPREGVKSDIDSLRGADSSVYLRGNYIASRTRSAAGEEQDGDGERLSLSAASTRSGVRSPAVSHEGTRRRELKTALRTRGLDPTGTTEELLQRLKAAELTTASVHHGLPLWKPGPALQKRVDSLVSEHLHRARVPRSPSRLAFAPSKAPEKPLVEPGVETGVMVHDQRRLPLDRLSRPTELQSLMQRLESAMHSLQREPVVSALRQLFDFVERAHSAGDMGLVETLLPKLEAVASALPPEPPEPPTSAEMWQDLVSPARSSGSGGGASSPTGTVRHLAKQVNRCKSYLDEQLETQAEVDTAAAQARRAGDAEQRRVAAELVDEIAGKVAAAKRAYHKARGAWQQAKDAAAAVRASHAAGSFGQHADERGTPGSASRLPAPRHSLAMASPRSLTYSRGRPLLLRPISVDLTEPGSGSVSSPGRASPSQLPPPGSPGSQLSPRNPPLGQLSQAWQQQPSPDGDPAPPASSELGTDDERPPRLRPRGRADDLRQLQQDEGGVEAEAEQSAEKEEGAKEEAVGEEAAEVPRWERAQIAAALSGAWRATPVGGAEDVEGCEDEVLLLWTESPPHREAAGAGGRDTLMALRGCQCSRDAEAADADDEGAFEVSGTVSLDEAEAPDTVATVRFEQRYASYGAEPGGYAIVWSARLCCPGGDGGDGLRMEGGSWSDDGGVVGTFRASKERDLTGAEGPARGPEAAEARGSRSPTAAQSI